MRYIVNSLVILSIDAGSEHEAMQKAVENLSACKGFDHSVYEEIEGTEDEE